MRPDGFETDPHPIDPPEQRAVIAPSPPAAPEPDPFLAVDQGLFQFWTQPMRAEGLALFRILLGATILLSTLLSLLPYFDRYLGPDGLCQPDNVHGWLDRQGRFCLLEGNVGLPPKPLLQIEPFKSWANEMHKEIKPDERWDTDRRKEMVTSWSYWGREWRRWGHEPSSIYLMLWLWVLSTTLMTVGLFSRVAAFMTFVLSVTFQNRVNWLNNGGDALFQVALFYLMLAPSGAVWSLDRLWKRWRGARMAAKLGRPLAPPRPVLVPAWPIRLAQIQICMVYFFTGAVKFMTNFLSQEWWDNDWINGQAVYWVLNDLQLNRFPYHCFPIPLAVCKLLSWLTILFEIGFPFFVMCRTLRPALLLGGVAFHLGIMLHTEVGWFSLVTISWYPLFLSGQLLESSARRIRPFLYRTRWIWAGLLIVFLSLVLLECVMWNYGMRPVGRLFGLRFMMPATPSAE